MSSTGSIPDDGQSSGGMSSPPPSPETLAYLNEQLVSAGLLREDAEGGGGSGAAVNETSAGIAEAFFNPAAASATGTSQLSEPRNTLSFANMLQKYSETPPGATQAGGAAAAAAAAAASPVPNNVATARPSATRAVAVAGSSGGGDGDAIVSEDYTSNDIASLIARANQFVEATSSPGRSPFQSRTQRPSSRAESVSRMRHSASGGGGVQSRSRLDPQIYLSASPSPSPARPPSQRRYAEPRPPSDAGSGTRAARQSSSRPPSRRSVLQSPATPYMLQPSPYAPTPDSAGGTPYSEPIFANNTGAVGEATNSADRSSGGGSRSQQFLLQAEANLAGLTRYVPTPSPSPSPRVHRNAPMQAAAGTPNVQNPSERPGSATSNGRPGGFARSRLPISSLVAGGPSPKTPYADIKVQAESIAAFPATASAATSTSPLATTKAAATSPLGFASATSLPYGALSPQSSSSLQTALSQAHAEIGNLIDSHQRDAENARQRYEEEVDMLRIQSETQSKLVANERLRRETLLKEKLSLQAELAAARETMEVFESERPMEDARRNAEADDEVEMLKQRMYELTEQLTQLKHANSESRRESEMLREMVDAAEQGRRVDSARTEELHELQEQQLQAVTDKLNEAKRDSKHWKQKYDETESARSDADRIASANSRRYENEKRQVGQLRDQHEAAVIRMREVESQLAEMHAELSQVNRDCDQLESQRDGLLDQAAYEQEQLQEQLLQEKSRASDFEDRFEVARDELHTMQDQLNEAEAAVEVKKREMGELESALAQAKASLRNREKGAAAASRLSTQPAGFQTPSKQQQKEESMQLAVEFEKAALKAETARLQTELDKANAAAGTIGAAAAEAARHAASDAKNLAMALTRSQAEVAGLKADLEAARTASSRHKTAAETANGNGIEAAAAVLEASQEVSSLRAELTLANRHVMQLKEAEFVARTELEVEQQSPSNFPQTAHDVQNKLATSVVASALRTGATIFHSSVKHEEHTRELMMEWEAERKRLLKEIAAIKHKSADDNQVFTFHEPAGVNSAASRSPTSLRKDPPSPLPRRHHGSVEVRLLQKRSFTSRTQIAPFPSEPESADEDLPFPGGDYASLDAVESNNFVFQRQAEPKTEDGESDQSTAAKTVVKIKSAFRGLQARNSLALQQTSADEARQHTELVEARNRRSNHKMKALFAGKHKDVEKEKEVQAAVLIQSNYRGYKVRFELEQEQKAALLIQSVFKGHQIRKQLDDAGIKKSVGQRLSRANRKSFSNTLPLVPEQSSSNARRRTSASSTFSLNSSVGSFGEGQAVADLDDGDLNLLDHMNDVQEVGSSRNRDALKRGNSLGQKLGPVEGSNVLLTKLNPDERILIENVTDNPHTRNGGNRYGRAVSYDGTPPHRARTSVDATADASLLSSSASLPKTNFTRGRIEGAKKIEQRTPKRSISLKLPSPQQLKQEAEKATAVKAADVPVVDVDLSNSFAGRRQTEIWGAKTTGASKGSSWKKKLQSKINNSPSHDHTKRTSLVQDVLLLQAKESAVGGESAGSSASGSGGLVDGLRHRMRRSVTEVGDKDAERRAGAAASGTKSFAGLLLQKAKEMKAAEAAGKKKSTASAAEAEGNSEAAHGKFLLPTRMSSSSLILDGSQQKLTRPTSTSAVVMHTADFEEEVEEEDTAYFPGTIQRKTSENIAFPAIDGDGLDGWEDAGNRADDKHSTPSGSVRFATTHTTNEKVPKQRRVTAKRLKPKVDPGRGGCTCCGCIWLVLKFIFVIIILAACVLGAMFASYKLK